MSEAKAGALRQEWQASAGPLPVGAGTRSCEAPPCCSYCSGRRRLTRMAKQATVLKGLVRLHTAAVLSRGFG